MRRQISSKNDDSCSDGSEIFKKIICCYIDINMVEYNERISKFVQIELTILKI